jgi:hypothetical protein
MGQPVKKVAFQLIQCCVLVAAAAAAAGCASSAKLPVSAGTGPSPTLPPPNKSLIPLVNVVKAKGWPEGAAPVAAGGTAVAAFAEGLVHPRWLYVLPNGDVLVAETNAPERPKDNRGIKGFFFKLFQKKAGGAVPSANRITLLRDADGDGVAETRSVFLSGLYSPFGIELVGNDLYVANSDAVVKFPYTKGATKIDDLGGRCRDLRLAFLVGELHDGVAVGHVEDVSHERHAERRIEPGQENRFHLGDAIAILVAQKGDPVGSRYSSAGLLHRLAHEVAAYPLAFVGPNRRVGLGDKHIAIWQHLEPARMIEPGRERLHPKALRSSRCLASRPADRVGDLQCREQGR